MDEAQQTEYSVRRVEFMGNEHTRDNILRKRFMQTEGDVFSRKALDQSLKNFSKLRMIYPVASDDVEVSLDREEKLIDFTIYFRERTGRSAKTH
jgi:outer membrane protein assembly factor BamA